MHRQGAWRGQYPGQGHKHGGQEASLCPGLGGSSEGFAGVWKTSTYGVRERGVRERALERAHEPLAAQTGQGEPTKGSEPPVRGRGSIFHPAANFTQGVG